MTASAVSSPASTRAARCLAVLVCLAASALFAAPAANAQDWGDDESGDWSEPEPAPAPTRTARPRPTSVRNAAAGWSFRTGIGFTADPDTFLLNFEAPYAFNEWVSAGPMMQVGLEDHYAIVAPTANLTLRVPDLPGRSFDRVHPFAFAGLGFAYIEKDRGHNDGDGVGFLIDTGVGVEYQVSEKVFLGTQMMFNFLPKETKDEGFFYAWQIAGIRFAF